MLHYHKEFPNVLTSMDLSTTNLNVILSIKKKKKNPADCSRSVHLGQPEGLYLVPASQIIGPMLYLLMPASLIKHAYL